MINDNKKNTDASDDGSDCEHPYSSVNANLIDDVVDELINSSRMDKRVDEEEDEAIEDGLKRGSDAMNRRLKEYKDDEEVELRKKVADVVYNKATDIGRRKEIYEKVWHTYGYC